MHGHSAAPHKSCSYPPQFAQRVWERGRERGKERGREGEREIKGKESRTGSVAGGRERRRDGGGRERRRDEGGRERRRDGGGREGEV